MDNYKKLYQHKWLMRIIAASIIAVNVWQNSGHMRISNVDIYIAIPFILLTVFLGIVFDKESMLTFVFITFLTVELCYGVLFMRIDGSHAYNDIGVWRSVLIDWPMMVFLALFITTEVARLKAVEVQEYLFMIVCRQIKMGRNLKNKERSRSALI